MGEEIYESLLSLPGDTYTSESSSTDSTSSSFYSHERSRDSTYGDLSDHAEEEDEKNEATPINEEARSTEAASTEAASTEAESEIPNTTCLTDEASSCFMTPRHDDHHRLESPDAWPDASSWESWKYWDGPWLCRPDDRSMMSDWVLSEVAASWLLSQFGQSVFGRSIWGPMEQLEWLNRTPVRHLIE